MDGETEELRRLIDRLQGENDVLRRSIKAWSCGNCGNTYELPDEQVEMASGGAEVVCPKCFQAMLPTNAYERELLRALLLRTLKIVSLAQVVTRSIKAIVTEFLPTLDEAQLSPAMARWLASARDIEETIQLLPPVLHEAIKDM